MQIRTFQAHDSDAVIELWNLCGLIASTNDPKKDIERKLKVGADLFFVGVLESEIIASAMGGYDGHRGWIYYLAVSPAHQRKRYAVRMMEQVEEALVARGCPKINLQVRSTNLEVITFYEKLGYSVEDRASLGKRLISDDQ